MPIRLVQLSMVLSYDTDTYTTTRTSYLTAGQRICINQERAFLLRKENEHEIYDQSAVVDEKVNFILEKLKKSNLTSIYANYIKEKQFRQSEI